MLLEALVHLALAVIALAITVYLSLKDYAADSGADVLLLIVFVATLGFGALGEVGAHFLGKHFGLADGARRLARYAGFMTPAFLAVALSMLGRGADQAKKDVEKERLRAMTTAALLDEANAMKLIVPSAAGAIGEKPDGIAELLAAIDAGDTREQTLYVLDTLTAKVSVSDRARAVAIAKAALAAEKTRRAAVRLATTLGDPALVQALRAPMTEAERQVGDVGRALVTCGDVSALDDYVGGKLELFPPRGDAPDRKRAPAQAVERAEQLWDAAKTVEQESRALRLVAWLDDPHRMLGPVAFDRKRADAVRQVAFDLWEAPERTSRADAAGMHAAAREAGSAAPQMLLLLLYRPAELDAVRGAAKMLGAEARDIYVREALSGPKGIRARSMELLGAFAGDEIAWAALAKIAGDRAEHVELRAQALESLAAVDAKKTLPLAEAVRKEALNHVSIGTAIEAVVQAAKR
ncbi:MAG: hypothetical protein IT381_13050 [Deltaproteobacteria bacterium]|nr:hypothetical protein [Deltaproteobacteria bacterium]